MTRAAWNGEFASPMVMDQAYKTFPNTLRAVIQELCVGGIAPPCIRMTGG